MKIKNVFAAVVTLGLMGAGLPAHAQLGDIISGVNLGARLLSHARRHEQHSSELNAAYRTQFGPRVYYPANSDESSNRSYSRQVSNEESDCNRARVYSGGSSLASYNTQNRAILMYNKGVQALNHENYEVAVSSFREALDINPNMGDGHEALGFAYAKMHDYEHALPELEAQVRIGSRNADTYFVAADTALKLQNYEKANAFFKGYLKRESSGQKADEARRAMAILENNYFHKAQGDYFADASKGLLRHWQLNGHPLKVFIKENPTVKGYKPEFAAILRSAFSEWSSGSAGKIRFEFTENESEAQLTCAWTDDRSKFESSNELGETQTVMDSEGSIQSAHIDLYTLIDDPARTPALISSTARNVALHEIGHALGMQHSQNVYDIMYAIAFPDGMEFALSERDTNTLVSMYEHADNKAQTGIISSTQQGVSSLMLIDDHDRKALKQISCQTQKSN